MLLLDLNTETHVQSPSSLLFTRFGSNWEIVDVSAGHVALKRSLKLNAGALALKAAIENGARRYSERNREIVM
jgi:hypothetical protein